MFNKIHIKAVLQALFVTLLWSTSWVLIKKGLKDMPPLTFAGLRYTIAFVVLFTWVILTKKGHMIKKLSNKQMIQLILLGIFMYMLTQGAQFLGLLYLPAVQVSLFLNFTPVIVIFFSFTFLGEKTTKLQILGIMLFLLGTMVYFYPIAFSNSKIMGFIIMAIGVISNAASSVLGRNINMKKIIDPIIITTISMGVGGILLLFTGILTQGFPSLTLYNWAIIIWLAVVNTAFAFYIWNRTLQILTSIESSMINNTMLIQITILAWLFMGESLDLKEIIGVVIAAIGTIIVQIKLKSTKKLVK